MKRERRIYLCGCLLVALLLSGCTYKAVRPDKIAQESPVRFAVIGDRTGGHQPGVYEQIVEEVRRLKPDFVVTVGDLIEGYSSDTLAVKDEWKEYMGLIESLSMPIYLVPGNHDIWDSTSLALYERHVGEPYYSFDERRIHFIVLDNSRFYTPSDLPAEQMDWLISDLEINRDADYTFALFHIPYWIETVAAGEPDTLHNLFAEYGVDAVFTGHYHEYFSGEFDGVVYTGVGSSGGDCEPGPTGLQYHFMWVTVDQEEISIAPVAMGGVLPWDELTADDRRLVRTIRQEAIHISKVPVAEDTKVPESGVAVEVANLNSDIVLSDTLRWDVPTGWKVDPEQTPIEIGASEVGVLEFKVMSAGDLYPTPALSLQYPYGEEKEFSVKSPLQVSRTAYARHAQIPPAIDGNLDEEIWSDGVTQFFAPDGSPASTDPAFFFFAWDPDNLYLAAKCMESEISSMAANATEHDGAVYGEDCIGYFVQTNLEDGPVYQIYFNPLGTPFDQKIMVEEGRAVSADREWNGEYEVGTFRGDDFWSIEVKIPLEQLEAAGKTGVEWAINFRRKQKRLESAGDWQVPITYDPADYGVLRMR